MFRGHCSFINLDLMCKLAQPQTVAAIIEKYSNPPDARPWELVEDTDKFWNDVNTLYRASHKEDTSAQRTLLTIRNFADGAISEGMPDLSEFTDSRPHME
jgi:hypothetical protein